MNIQKTLYPFALILVSVWGLFGQRSITLIDEFGADQTDVVLNYQSWDGQGFWTGLDDATFQHALEKDLINPTPNGIINYINWEGIKFSAKVDGDVFIDAPNGDFSRATRVDEINYRTIDGRKWAAALKSYSVVRPPEVIVLIIEPFVIVGNFNPTGFIPTIPQVILNIGSLADVFPDQSSPYLLDDLGFFDYTTVEDGYAEPWPLSRAMGALADTALLNFTTNLEAYKANLSPASAAAVNVNNVRERIRADTEVKAAVNALLYLLVSEAILDTEDQSLGTVAIRNWSAKIYKEQNVAIAENTLQEYLKWKASPCTYPGATCPRGLSALLAAPKPPLQAISQNGTTASVANAVNITGALTIASGIVGTALSFQFFFVPAVIASGGIVYISGISAATFIAGPAGIVLASVVTLVLEGIAVGQAANAQRDFEGKVSAAKNEVVDIVSIVANNPSIYRLAFFRVATTPL